MAAHVVKEAGEHRRMRICMPTDIMRGVWAPWAYLDPTSVIVGYSNSDVQVKLKIGRASTRPTL
jgi:hypothetical protein